MPVGVSAWVPLANITLTSTATSITFSNISQSYRDLILMSNGINSVSGDEIYARFNSDSGSNYFFVQMYGTGASAASNVGTNTFAGAGRIGAAASNVWHVFDYSATGKHKTMLVRGDLASTYTTAQAQRWASTAAITSITLFNGTFQPGATFALYGVSA